MIKLKQLIKESENSIPEEYDPETEFVLDKRPIIMVRKLVETFLKELEPLKKEFGFGNVRVHFITHDTRDALARYVHNTKKNPHFVMSTRTMHYAVKKYGGNLGVAIFTTLVHEFCHAYLDSIGIDPWEHDEDLIEEAARDYQDDNNAKKLRERLDAFAKDTYAHYFAKRHKLREIEYPMAGERDQKAYAGYAGYKGKIVWMSPDKFLHLAPPLDDPNLNKLKYVEDRIKKNQPIDFLVLWVDVDRNRVISHEGRHRATVAKKLGVEKIPVLIIVYSHQNYDSYPRVPQWTPRQHDYADKAEFVPQSNKLEEVINHFRGWISPNGKEFNTDDGGTHDSHANQLLRKFYPNWRWESIKQFQSGGAVFAEAALLYKGWIRVVDNGIYSVYKITPNIKSTLIELISDLPNKHEVRLDVEVGSRKTWSSTAEEVLDWLSND